MLRIARKLLHPTAQLRLVHTKILRGLGMPDPAFLDQPHRFKLELACKLPPLHDPPPVPLKHLTRCLRNRVQANGHKITERTRKDGSKSFTVQILLKRGGKIAQAWAQQPPFSETICEPAQAAWG